MVLYIYIHLVNQRSYKNQNLIQIGLTGATSRFIRSWVAPILLVVGWIPTSANSVEVVEIVLSVLFLKLLLEIYRAQCRPPTTKDQRNMRIMLAGDAFPPKVDGVSTFAQQSTDFLRNTFGHEVLILTSVDNGKDNLHGAKISRLPGMTTAVSPGHSVTIPTFEVFWIFMKVCLHTKLSIICTPSIPLIHIYSFPTYSLITSTHFLTNYIHSPPQFQPHVVHLFEVSILNLIMVLYCQIADIPCVFSHHTRIDLYVNIVTPNWPKWLNESVLFSLERLFYPMADAHLSVCTILKDKVRERGTFKSLFWSSGVDTKFKREMKSKEWRHFLSGGHPELPLILHVGRLGVEKNSEEIPDIIKETTKLMGGVDKVRFAVVGDGNLFPMIKEKLEGHMDNVVLAGYRHGEELLQSYASSDVFFSPSTTEAFPLVYLEAMSSGLAVVGPRAGGVADAFRHGIHGHLFAAHRPAEAAQAIKLTIEGGEEMREAAHAHGSSFSWEQSVGELQSTLKGVVRDKENSGSHLSM